MNESTQSDTEASENETTANGTESSETSEREALNLANNEEQVWTRVVMGAAEGDQSMFASLNLEIAWLSAGVDCEIEWQWDGGHVPSEIFGESLALTVDEKYGTYVSGVETTKEAATVQTVNGTAEQATGTDISSWVDASDSDARHWDKFLLNIFENEEYAGVFRDFLIKIKHIRKVCGKTQTFLFYGRKRGCKYAGLGG